VPIIAVPVPGRGEITDLAAEVALPIIAGCESGGRQHDDDGHVIINRKTDDLGKYQVNLPTHWARAEALGINLWTEADNEQFARLLLEENPDGRDWNASRDCWEPKLPLTSLGVTITVTRELSGIVLIPKGYTLKTDRRDKDNPVAYMIRTTFGRKATPIEVPRIISGRFLAPKSETARFQVIDKEFDSMELHVSLVPIPIT
jgi:hypothetical protein